MTLEAELAARFSWSGSFELRPNESINDVVRESGVPNEFGVYAIRGDLGSAGPVIYIGKAGTFNQDGSRMKQGLARRLTMKQNGVYRRKYFCAEIERQGRSGLTFSWYVTYHNDQTECPALIEAQLLADHLAQFGRLPRLNRSF